MAFHRAEAEQSSFAVRRTARRLARCRGLHPAAGGAGAGARPAPATDRLRLPSPRLAAGRGHMADLFAPSCGWCLLCGLPVLSGRGAVAQARNSKYAAAVPRRWPHDHRRLGDSVRGAPSCSRPLRLHAIADWSPSTHLRAPVNRVRVRLCHRRSGGRPNNHRRSALRPGQCGPCGWLSGIFALVGVRGCRLGAVEDPPEIPAVHTRVVGLEPLAL